MEKQHDQQLPTPEAPKPEEQPQDQPAPEPETPPAADEGSPDDAPDTDKGPEAPEPKEGEDDPDQPDQQPKKRSIYDDLKGQKQKRKEAQEQAERVAQENEQLKARNDELERLMKEHDKAQTPQQQAQANDDLATFAEEQGLSVDALERLTGLIANRALPPEFKQTFEEFQRFSQQQKVQAEDQEVRAQEPTIRKELGIDESTDTSALMEEVVRLSHTKEFHDKELDYIVWKNRDALSKLVTPKKKSFEQGSDIPLPDAQSETTDPSQMTPEQLSKTAFKRRGSSYEIRSRK